MRAYWTDVFQANRFPVHLSDLLKIDGQPERAQYEFLNLPRGYLFDRFNGPISNPRGQEVVCVWKPGREVFDTVLQTHVSFTEELYLNLPNTFTFTLKPEDDQQEVEYFVRAIGLPKHSFVWSNDVDRTGISCENYSAIRGDSNKAYRGRFTFTPHLPGIKELGHHDENGFYTMDEAEWEAIFQT